MNVAICGSMAFAKEMLDIKNALEKKGHFVYMPDETEEYVTDEVLSKQARERLWQIGADRKIQRDLIRKHYEKIKDSDAILILNYPRKGINGYIGGNTFLEMGFAHVLNKEIYCMHELPVEMEFTLEEMKAMRPVILNGDLSKLA